MLDEIEISSPQPFDPGQALSKQASSGAPEQIFSRKTLSTIFNIKVRKAELKERVIYNLIHCVQ